MGTASYCCGCIACHPSLLRHSRTSNSHDQPSTLFAIRHTLQELPLQLGLVIKDLPSVRHCARCWHHSSHTSARSSKDVCPSAPWLAHRVLMCQTQRVVMLTVCSPSAHPEQERSCNDLALAPHSCLGSGSSDSISSRVVSIRLSSGMARVVL